MTVQLYSVTDEGAVHLPVPPDAKTIHDPFRDLPLGVYSAFRTYQHFKFLRLDAHIDRTVKSMKLLGWTYELDRPRFYRALDTACRAYPLAEARVRVDVLAAPAARLGTDSRELISLAPFQPLPESYYSEGVSVEIVAKLRRSSPKVKNATFVEERESFQKEKKGSHELLMVNSKGEILEGAGSNFYGVRDGVLYTAQEGVLDGIARGLVLELAADEGIPVVFRPVRLDEISQLDEAGLSSSSRGYMPVVEISGRIVGSGRPGPVAIRLRELYEDYVARSARPALAFPISI